MHVHDAYLRENDSKSAARGVAKYMEKPEQQEHGFHVVPAAVLEHSALKPLLQLLE